MGNAAKAEGAHSSDPGGIWKAKKGHSSAGGKKAVLVILEKGGRIRKTSESGRVAAS